jgi:hypothetical protein
MATFAAKLSACQSIEAVEAATLCDDVLRTSKTFGSEERARMQALITSALDRYR